MSPKIKRLVSSGFAFGASKGAVFLVPLVLSNLLSVGEYGLFESSLAYGSVLAVVLSAGVSAALPYFMLTRGVVHYNGVVYFHSLMLALLLFPLYLAYTHYGLPILFGLSLLFAGIVAGQRAFSADMKARSHPGWASFSDSFIYILVLLLVLLMMAPISLDKIFRAVFWSGVPILMLASLAAAAKYRLARPWGESFSAVYKYSLPTVMPVITLLMITSLVRLVAPWVLPHEELAIYSFYFRFASISVIAFQFLAILYFSVMYNSEPARLDKAFLYVGLLVFVLSIAGFFVFPLFLSEYFRLFSSYQQYWGLYLILIFFCYFWVAEAMLEPIIYRERQATSFLLAQVKALALVTGGGAVFYAVAGKGVRVLDLACLHTLLMALIVFMQIRILRKEGISLPYFSCAGVFFAALLLILYFSLKIIV